MDFSAFFFLFLVTLFGTTCSVRDWWMEEPYKDDSFNVLGKYGENVSIECADHRRPEPEDVLYWILPDLTVMNRSDYKDFQTIDGPAGWYVSPNGTSVEVFLVQERHFGFYHCVFSNRSSGRDGGGSGSSSSSVEVIKKGLNYDGPYLGDLWPLYEKPVVIGCVAAGIFAALFAVLCVVYEARFHEEIEVTAAAAASTAAAAAAERDSIAGGEKRPSEARESAESEDRPKSLGAGNFGFVDEDEKVARRRTRNGDNTYDPLRYDQTRL